MKRKLFALMAGIVVLVAPVVSHQAFAQSSPDRFPALEGVELTAAQKDQLAQMRAQGKSQIEAILTPDQQAQLRTAIAQKQGFRQAIATLNLTADQKTQLRQLYKANRQQFNTVLTPEQRQQVRQNVEQRHPQLAAVHSQIKAVLTPEQQTQLQTALEAGQLPREAMASLNLSADQKAQIKTILRSAHQQAGKTPVGAEK